MRNNNKYLLTKQQLILLLYFINTTKHHCRPAQGAQQGIYKIYSPQKQA